MDSYILWFIAAAVVVAAELFVGTLYLLVVALGAVAGGVASLAGGAVWMQFVAAAFFAVAGLAGMRLRGSAVAHSVKAPTLSLDAGQLVEVVERRANGSLRVAYRGSHWEADLEPDAGQEPYVVREVRGTRLLIGARKQ